MVDRADWIQAALKALVRAGPEAVRVEPLAKQLKVTKGSFYWHFQDRAALLDALLERWREVATLAVMQAVDPAGPGPEARLKALVSMTSQSKEAPAIEGAIRAWSASDPRARKVVKAIDRARERYVTELLVKCGLAPKLAALRAHLLYLALIGEFSLVGHGCTPSGPGPFAELLRLLLTPHSTAEN